MNIEPSTPVSRRKRTIVTCSSMVAGLAVLAFLLSGCGEPEPTAYTAQNRSEFMAACSDGVAPSVQSESGTGSAIDSETDSDQLVQDVCACFYDAAVAADGLNYSFSEFVALDDSLKEQVDSTLPPDVISAIASCYIEEADL